MRQLCCSGCGRRHEVGCRRVFPSLAAAAVRVGQRQRLRLPACWTGATATPPSQATMHYSKASSLVLQRAATTHWLHDSNGWE